MGLRNTAEKWGGVARTLHWLVAALIVAAIVLGVMREDVPQSQLFLVLTLHKSMGLLVLALVLCRIVWRLGDKAPRPLPTMPRWQIVSAEIVHWALYGLMLAVPVTGYLMSSFGHYPFPFFMQEAWPVPLVLDRNPALQEVFSEVHETLAWVMVGVLVAHIGAALYHHFVAKDAILARMTPFVRVPRRS